MADNKNHHFVPQFYLRYFSSNKKGINLLNLKMGKVVLGAALRQQCSRDYFYGKDVRYERALGEVEAASSGALRKLIDSKRVFSKDSPDFISILIYVSLQYYRTGSKVDYLNQMVDGLAKDFLKYQIPAEDLSKFTIGMDGLSNLAVRNAFNNYAMLIDMEWLLVEAEPGCEFITSDTPVLFLNTFFPKDIASANTGIVSSGLIVLFPLTPTLTLVLFDGVVYRPHGLRNNQAFSHVVPRSDVDQLNDCQCASADENIYFRSDQLDVAEIFRRSKRLRPSQKVIQTTFVKEDSAESRRELIVTRQAAPRLAPRISFLKERKGAVRWRGDFLRQKVRQEIVLRNPWLHGVLKEYQKLEDEGRQVPPILEFIQMRADQQPR
ncbi:MAG: DUF4238 domain-containing protein [Burkholderiaceae bacterium]|nr:DUF4238 domain-containing protein [Burkholderiaceae bacterium]